MDSSARVVGINTALAGIGLGLAVPINDATRTIVSALIRDGRVRRATLGPPWRRAPLHRQLPTGWAGAGVAIVQVLEGSPAERAGLRRGDLLSSSTASPSLMPPPCNG